jgi:hypothetical protein
MCLGGKGWRADSKLHERRSKKYSRKTGKRKVRHAKKMKKGTQQEKGVGIYQQTVSVHESMVLLGRRIVCSLLASCTLPFTFQTYCSLGVSHKVRRRLLITYTAGTLLPLPPPSLPSLLSFTPYLVLSTISDPVPRPSS